MALILALLLATAHAEPSVVGVGPVTTPIDGTSESFALYRCLNEQARGDTWKPALVDHFAQADAVVTGEVDTGLSYRFVRPAGEVFGNLLFWGGAGALLGLAAYDLAETLDTYDPRATDFVIDAAPYAVGATIGGLGLLVFTARTARPHRYRWEGRASLTMHRGTLAASRDFPIEGRRSSRELLDDARTLALDPTCAELARWADEEFAR